MNLCFSVSSDQEEKQDTHISEWQCCRDGIVGVQSEEADPVDRAAEI